MGDKEGVGSNENTRSDEGQNDARDWNDDDVIFACRLCDSRFSSASLLSWHYHQCHTDKPERSDPRTDGQYPCVYCWQKFESYRGLIGHISSAHASVWYHSLAAASRLDEYNYMRPLVADRSPINSSLNVTSSLTRPPVMTSPLITPPDVKPKLLPDLNTGSSGSDSEPKYRIPTPASVSSSPIPSTSKDNRVPQQQQFQDSTKILINGREQFLCKFCDSIFHTSAEVDDHVTAVHSSTSRERSGGKYECQYCPEAFPLYTALQEHIRCYHGDEYYRRRGRKDATPPLTPPAIKRPTPRPSPDQPHVFKCQLCVSGFTENSLLADHYRKVHGVPTSPLLPTVIKTEPKPHPLSVSESEPHLPEPKFVSNLTESKPDVSAEQVTGPPLEYQASRSENRSVNERPLLTAKSERSPEDQPMEEGGDSQSASASSEAIELKYICEVCDARFPLYVSMQEHIRTAHGERPFECDVCRKQFTKRCYLLKHLQSHPNTHYDCLHCGRRFSSWTQRRDHMMQHEVEGVFLCTHCGSRFTLQRHLEQHLRTHADASHVLVCVDCNHKFDDSMEFQEHVRSHVRCPYCSQVFDTNKNLVDHIESTHQKAKLQGKFQHEVKKPQKIVAPVPKNKAQSPSKVVRTDSSNSSIPSTSSTSLVSTAVTTASTSSSSSSSTTPFGGSIAPMYVWMPGSHFPAAVFPTLSIVSPQLTAMQALNDPHASEQRNLQQSLLNSQLQAPSNLLPGYPAYALPYPYQSHPLLVPPVEEQQTSGEKRRRTPEAEPSGRKPKVSKQSSPSVSEEDTRQRYGTLIDRLNVPLNKPVLEDVPEPKREPEKAKPDQFVCKQCAEILPTAELLARHEAEHNDDSPLNLSCKPDQKPKVADVNQPMAVNDIKPEPARKLSLESEQLCEITPVGSDFFRCEMCMSIISNLHLVEKHLNEHFLMQPVDDDKLTFSCGKCRISFKQRSEFFYHLLKNHTDDNYFQCNICKKKFITERFLDKHMNVHLLAQNFTCQFCNKGFYLADVCNRHERLHWQCGDKPKMARKRSDDSEGGAAEKVDMTETSQGESSKYGLESSPSAHHSGERADLPPTGGVLTPAGGVLPLSALTIPPAAPLTPGQKQHVYVMYKCLSCQMEFSHKRQVKHHLANSACALDDRTSSKHYSKFHKCKLCHFVFEHSDKIIQHFLIRHQMDIDQDSGPRSDNSTSSGSTDASGHDGDNAFDIKVQSDSAERERSPSELKWALIKGKTLPPQLVEPALRPPEPRQPPGAPHDADEIAPNRQICPSCGREFVSVQQLDEHDCSVQMND